MTKRIFRSVLITAMISVLLAAVLIVYSMFNVYEKEMMDELRTEADYLTYALERETDETAYFEGFSSANRVTLISPDGTVLYDSGTDAAGLDNHAQRPEVLSALDTGFGQSERYSDTLAERTYYFAQRTAGGNVLRVSNTLSSVLGAYMQTLPLICAILLLVALLSFQIARVVARKIVAPLNALNLDQPLENDIYDELSSLLVRMDHQHKEIARQMNELDAARRELNAITQNMREGLIIIDSKGAVLTMNSSAARLFGVDAQAHIGQNLVSVSRNPSVREVVAAAQRGESADAVMERADRYHRLLANPVFQEGRVAGVVLLTLDVTERYTAEISRREFTANVSHELKTPLTSISGYAEIIRDGVARPEDVSGFADRIHSEANHLLNLINDILELGRLDERRGLGEQERVNLRTISCEAAQRLENTAKEKNIDLRVQGEEAEISGYALLLKEMVFNLIDNAVKYTQPGGQVEVDIQNQPGGALLRVQDTGIGIPKAHQPHVFERFYRVDKSHSRATGGTGLGLSIVKHGAEIHNATVTLESEVGKGTCVTLKFNQ